MRFTTLTPTDLIVAAQSKGKNEKNVSKIIIIIPRMHWTNYMFGKNFFGVCVTANLFWFLWILLIIKRLLVHAKRLQKRWESKKCKIRFIFSVYKWGFSVNLNVVVLFWAFFRWNTITTNLSPMLAVLLHLYLHWTELLSQNTYIRLEDINFVTCLQSLIKIHVGQNVN